jgi:hypothetical protein
LTNGSRYTPRKPNPAISQTSDGLVDDRLGEDAGEHESEHAGDESGQRAAQDNADFHERFSLAGQWQGKPRKWRESRTYS